MNVHRNEVDPIHLGRVFNDKVYRTLMEQKLHTVLHTARRSSVYAVHPDYSLHTLLMLQIFHEPIDNECLFTVPRS